VAALTAIGALLAVEPRAAACGGCFHPPRENPTVVTDHRMIFAVSPKQTTLYDQMRYTGSPSSFAWVLPIANQVTIGLSSDELFQVLDSQTSVQVIAPELNCYVPSSCIQAFPPSDRAVSATPAPGGGAKGGGVTVLAQEVVGPYETVQLRATDPKALATWLSAHHYEITPDAQAIIDGYVNEKSAFLAMKLVPGATVQAMRPVRVTAPGASVTLPLRMVAAGAGATLGVTLWVVSEGRYEPQNFPFFTIAEADVVWDWTTSSSNYATVRATKTKAADNTGWQIESSLDVSTQNIANQLRYMTPRAQPTPRPPPATARGDAGADAGSKEKSDEEQRADDLEVLYGGTSTHPTTVRVTRMRADLAHSALSKDLRVQASSDQKLLSNVVQVTREAAPPLCPVYDDNCSVVGNAPRPEAEAKNKALSNPHFSGSGLGGGNGKKLFSCAASREATSWSPHALIAALAIAGASIVRRNRRRR
jgi:hypothetical protein